MQSRTASSDHFIISYWDDDAQTIDRLRNMTDEVYHYGYALVKYVVSTYGADGMLKLYKSTDVNATFNINENDFRDNWKAYLIKSYSMEV